MQKLRPIPQDVNVVPLPPERLQELPCFSYVGIDLAGPLYVSDKVQLYEKDHFKRYYLIISCFSSRMTHIELILSRETDEVLSALRRFMARRGIPIYIYCDNEGAFEKSERELKHLWKGINFQKLQAAFNTEAIRFHFNIPVFPARGGIYERINKIIKNILKQKIGRKSLSTWEMQTILAQAEMITNSRPLGTTT